MPGKMARKRMNSFIVKDKTNVKVFVRVRPFNSREEKSAAIGPCIAVNGEGTATLQNLQGSPRQSAAGACNFGFDRAFWSNPRHESEVPVASQEVVYEDVGEVLLTNAFEGFHGCLFAYGQTGSGKTFTMMGDRTNRENWGIIPRLCEDLFQRIAQDPDNKYGVSVSYIEIYNEEIHDLLVPASKASHQEKEDLPFIRETERGVPEVVGNRVMDCQSIQDINKVLARGDSRRSVASTDMNDQSSRSHSIFTIHLKQEKQENGRPVTLHSKINLIDLAGSERVEDSGVIGQGLKEAININKSLTTLGRVMDALVEISEGKGGKARTIPYRESVLTRALQDSIGGNSKTMMFANVSPSHENIEETRSTLQYACRARKIKTSAKINKTSEDGAPLSPTPPPATPPPAAAEVEALKRKLEETEVSLRTAQGAAAQARVEAGELRAQSANQAQSAIASQEEAAKIKQKFDESTAQLEEANGRAQMLQSQLADAKAGQEAAANRLKIQETEAKNLGNKYEQCRAELRRQEDVARQSGAENRVLRSENQKQAATIDHLQRVRESEERLRDELASKLEVATTRMGYLEEEYKVAAQQRDALRAENLELQLRMEQSVAQVRRLEANVKHERERSGQWLMELAKLEDDVKHMSIKVPRERLAGPVW